MKIKPLKESPVGFSEVYFKLNEVIDALNSLAEKYGDTLDSRMENGQTYWTFTTYFDVVDSVWRNDSIDKMRNNFGNVFTSREAAEEAAKRVKALLLSLRG